MTYLVLVHPLLLARVGLNHYSSHCRRYRLFGIARERFYYWPENGYRIGLSPINSNPLNFWTPVSALTVGGVILILSKTYGYTGEGSRCSSQIWPQLLNRLCLWRNTWILYIIGVIPIVLDRIGIFALAFPGNVYSFTIPSLLVRRIDGLCVQRWTIK